MLQQQQSYYTDQFETERLVLRPVQTSDEKPWAEFFKDPESLRFLGFPENASPEELSIQWIKKQQDRYRNNQYGLKAMTDKTNGVLLGMCGLLLQQINGAQEIEIGYHLLKEHRGKGYAREAAGFFKEYAFQNKITSSLISIIHPGNLRSQKVAVTNGMRTDEKALWHNEQVLIYRFRNSI